MDYYSYIIKGSSNTFSMMDGAIVHNNDTVRVGTIKGVNTHKFRCFHENIVIFFSGLCHSTMSKYLNSSSL